MRYLAILFLLFSFRLFSQTGLKSPASTGEDYNEWTNPSDGFSSNDTRARAQYDILPADQDYYNFTLGLPAGATIDGIVVSVEMYSNSALPYHCYIQVELSWNGGVSYTTTGYYAITTTAWNDEIHNLGGASNTWGRSWTDTELSNANFRVRLTFIDDAGQRPWQSELDHVQVNVYYNGGGGGGTPSDTIWVDAGVDGDDLNPGTEAEPIKSLAELEDVITASTAGMVIMMADTIYHGTLSVSNKDGSLAVPYIITTWHKYTEDGQAVISGFKELGTFADEAGNIWTITDTDLDDTYRSDDDDYVYNVLMRNWLLINRNNYAVSRYPNTGYLQAESWSTANPATYIHDNTALNDNYDDAILIGTDEEWGIFRAKVDWDGSDLDFQSGYSSSDMTTINDWNNAGSGYYLKYALSNLAYFCDANGDHSYDPDVQELSVYYSGDLNNQTVEYPYNDFGFRITGSDYWQLRDIKFEGNNIANVYSNGGSNITADSCTFDLTPGWAALYATYINTIDITSNTFTNGAGGGVFLWHCDDPTIEHNYLDDLSMSDVMMPDLLDGATMGIYMRECSGVINVNYNRVDSIGYHGISVSEFDEGVTSKLMEGNIVTNSMQLLNDGGAIYCFETQNLSSYSRIIRNNYVENSIGNPDFSYANRSSSYGIYLDGGANYYTVDSNTVIRSVAGVNMNGTDNNTISANTLYKNNVNPNRSGSIKAQEYGHYSATTDCDFNNNLIIIRDSTIEHGILWVDTDGTLNANGTTSDNNKFFNPFNEDGYIGVTIANWSNETRRTLATMFATNLAFEDNSTFNSPNWTYQDVSGITRDEFVWIFYNFSDAPHYFNLGNSTFRELLTTSTVSDSILVAPYKSTTLLYYSGNLSGIDDKVYYGIGGGGGDVLPPIPPVPPGTFVLIDSMGVNFTNSTFLKYQWNNFTDPASVNDMDLDYFDGSPSGINMSSDDIWGFGVGANGYIPGYFPDSVQRTNFIADDAAWKDFTFTGLVNNHYYTFDIMASRINNGETRQTLFVINENGIVMNVTDNDYAIATFEKVQPTSGAITLRCQRYLGNYAYINGIVIKEYELPTPTPTSKILNRIVIITYN